MSDDLQKELFALIKQSADEFFSAQDAIADYRYEAASNQFPVSNTVYASVIGFSGAAMNGSLVVICERALLDKSHPNHSMGMPVGDGEIQDWSGEMANQLLGRIKNKLDAGGIKLQMSTPTTVVGKSMQITTPKDGFVHQMCYRGSSQDCQLHFLGVVIPGTTLTISNKQAATTATEGDSFIF